MFFVNLIFIFFAISTTQATTNSTTTAFSNSIIIINGEKTIAITSDSNKYKGILANIDWNQVPDFGFPKDEIHTIQVVERSSLKYNGNNISLSPNKWLFIANNWVKEYTGNIPYLANLEFLPQNITNKLQMDNELLIVQNPLGYYQDRAYYSLGFNSAINRAETTVISSILIISSLQNQEIYNISRKLDTIIVQENILDDISIIPIDIEEITANFNATIDDIQNTNNTNGTNMQIDTSTNPSSDSNSIIDRSINTSIDKRENRNN